MARLTEAQLKKLPLHERIKAAREQIKPQLRQDDLAKKIRVSRWTVMRWEAGEHPPTGERAVRLARALGYPTELFLGPPRQVTRRDLESRLEALAELVVDHARTIEQLATRVTALEGKDSSARRTRGLPR